MEFPRFERPKSGHGDPTPNLYVANCGPAVGVSHSTIQSVFWSFGEVIGVYNADESGARVVVCYSEESGARAALETLDGRPCPLLGGRTLHIRYSIPKPSSQVSDSVSVSLRTEELDIPGLILLHDFVNSAEEEALLKEVDERPWKSLSKRRVQHYGYEFCYQTRNVNTRHFLGELPSFVSPILDRISLFPNSIDAASSLVLDQLTVNEYPPGVGLSPHIDTHSAFEGCIFSLSLAGPCIMEFRKYAVGVLHKSCSTTNMNIETQSIFDYQRKAIFLPPRSMLLLSGEARYAWHHYIPHHKMDMVNSNVIKRAKRRVSFTFRKVRKDPCKCEYANYCDSQQ